MSAAPLSVIEGAVVSTGTGGESELEPPPPHPLAPKRANANHINPVDLIHIPLIKNKMPLAIPKAKAKAAGLTILE
jgi:hypothetical protein